MKNKLLIDMSNLAHRVYHSVERSKGFKVKTTKLIKEKNGINYNISCNGNMLSINNINTNNTHYLFGKITNGVMVLDSDRQQDSRLVNGIINLNKVQTTSLEIIEEYPYRVFTDNEKNFFVIRTDDKQQNLFKIDKEGLVETSNYSKIEFKKITQTDNSIIEVTEIQYNSHTKTQLKDLFKKVKPSEMYTNFDLLVHNLINSVLHESKKFNTDLKDIVACFDSSSWRKEFLVDLYSTIESDSVEVDKTESESIDTIQGLDYKGTRVKNYGTIIFEMLDTALKILPKLNISAIQRQKYEADDLIAIYAAYSDVVYSKSIENRNNEENQEVLSTVFSNDGDFLQLLQHPNTKIYDPKLKKDDGKSGAFVDLTQIKKYKLFTLYLKTEFLSNYFPDEKINYNNADEFFNSQPEIIQENFNKNLTNIEKQLPEIFLLLKIFEGDSSDNISSVVPELSYKDTPVKIQYGEITILKNIAKVIQNNNFNFNFAQTSDILSQDLLTKLYTKSVQEVKKNKKAEIAELKKEKKSEKYSKEEIAEAVNMFIIQNLASNHLSGTQIMNKIDFLIHRNNVMINFDMIPQELIDEAINSFQEYEEQKEFFSKAESYKFLKDRFPKIANNFFYPTNSHYKCK